MLGGRAIARKEKSKYTILGGIRMYIKLKEEEIISIFDFLKDAKDCIKNGRISEAKIDIDKTIDYLSNYYIKNERRTE